MSIIADNRADVETPATNQCPYVWCSFDHVLREVTA